MNFRGLWFHAAVAKIEIPALAAIGEIQGKFEAGSVVVPFARSKTIFEVVQVPVGGRGLRRFHVAVSLILRFLGFGVA